MISNVQDGRVLDVSGGKDEERANVIVHKRHGGANQRWKIVYTDSQTKEATKGLDTTFNFYINRPFYIVSRLPMKYVIEMHPNNHPYLRKWAENRPQA